MSGNVESIGVFLVCWGYLGIFVSLIVNNPRFNLCPEEVNISDGVERFYLTSNGVLLLKCNDETLAIYDYKLKADVETHGGKIVEVPIEGYVMDKEKNKQTIGV